MASAYTVQSNNYRKTWLLIFFFVGMVSAIFYGVSWYYGNLTIAFIGLFLSLFQAFVAYFAGDKIALKVAGAKEVSEKEAPEIHFLVDNLSKVADIPKPKVHISPDPSANAFACGRKPETASICLNQGLIDLLDKNEIEGVIAHELAHIKNRDILVMTVAMVLASVVSFVADIGARMMLFGGSDRDSKNNNPIAIVIYIAVLILAPIVSLFIQMAISRSREYLADATAVTFTRYPKGLVNALKKLYKNPVPSKHYSTSMNHFYISPPKKKWGAKAAGLFSTHPSIEDRVKALSEMG